MNSENGKTSKPHVLIVKLTYKLDLRKGEKSIALSKTHTKIINLKYQLQHGMMNFNCQMDHILYQIFKTILSIF